MQTNYTEMKNKLHAALDKERFEHSLATADCAVELAEEYGENTEKAYAAGLLHDCAKCFDKVKMKEIADKITLDTSEKNNPKTIHAPVSAWVAQHEYGIKDREILSAIRFHTIGKKNMTTFEKIIYLADKVEPKTRLEPYFEEIRTALKKGLDAALLVSYQNTVKSLKERNLEICPITLEIYEDLKTKCAEHL